MAAKVSLEHEATSETRRGHHRILLGAAAGVGKTYRMLLEGQQAADSGIDVVIGYLEPHDRKDTIALAEGLQRCLAGASSTPAFGLRRWTWTPCSGVCPSSL